MQWGGGSAEDENALVQEVAALAESIRRRIPTMSRDCVLALLHTAGALSDSLLGAADRKRHCPGSYWRVAGASSEQFVPLKRKTGQDGVCAVPEGSRTFTSHTGPPTPGGTRHLVCDACHAKYKRDRKRRLPAGTGTEIDNGK